MSDAYQQIEEGVFRCADSSVPGGFRYRITNTKLRALGEPDENNLPVGLKTYPDIVDHDHVLRPHVEIIYSDDDHARWKHLFLGMEETIPNRVSQEVADGFAWIRRIGGAERIPSLDMMNKDIEPVSGFRLVQVMGLVPNDEFFTLLMNGKFPVTLSVRRANEFAYTSFPDIFHDLAGHAPMFLNTTFCDFVRKIGALGLKFSGDDALQMAVAKIYWYTIEFGLMTAPAGNPRSCVAYGSGIVSSVAETIDSVESDIAADFNEDGNRMVGTRKINRLRFDVDRILRTHYDFAKPQEIYFVIDSYAQLNAVFDNDIENHIRRFVAENKGREIPQGQLMDDDVLVPTWRQAPLKSAS